MVVVLRQGAVSLAPVDTRYVSPGLAHLCAWRDGASFSSHESSSEDNNVLILAAVGLELEEQEQIKRRQRRRRWWMRPWIARREQFGACHAQMSEVEVEDPESYVNFVRMHNTFSSFWHP